MTCMSGIPLTRTTLNYDCVLFFRSSILLSFLALPAKSCLFIMKDHEFQIKQIRAKQSFKSSTSYIPQQIWVQVCMVSMIIDAKVISEVKVMSRSSFILKSTLDENVILQAKVTCQIEFISRSKVSFNVGRPKDVLPSLLQLNLPTNPMFFRDHCILWTQNMKMSHYDSTNKRQHSFIPVMPFSYKLITFNISSSLSFTSVF